MFVQLSVRCGSFAWNMSMRIMELIGVIHIVETHKFDYVIEFT